MAAPVEVKLRNAESSILFMQQEHAKTLQALHQELHKLQKKCAELNFELAMKSDDVDEEKYKSEIEALTAKLGEKEKECNQLKTDRDTNHDRLNELEQQMKVREKIFQDDLAQRQQKILTLTAELEQRSGTIAYLTTQLHQLKRKEIKPTVEHVRSDPERNQSPAPPKDPAPPRTRRYNIRTGNGPVKGVHPVNCLRNDANIPQPSQVQSHMFSRFRRIGPPPKTANPVLRSRGCEGVRDVTAFIAHVDTQGREVEVKPVPSILPPITPQDAVRREYSLSAEIETLAIDKPYGADSSLRSPNHSPLHTD
ncbi:coiled-coil domain-containing protein 92-like [Lytechinus pictus]|uniref:coiled-coil domain-containing protein 92-like n=1 Tax=Lytechinus pictus TaxID=7653 RepID=UPI0030B9E9B9